jgi:hypothetical protein
MNFPLFVLSDETLVAYLLQHKMQLRDDATEFTAKSERRRQAALAPYPLSGRR